MPSPVFVLEVVVGLIVLITIRRGKAPSWLVGRAPDADELAAAHERNRLLEEDLATARARIAELGAEDEKPTEVLPAIPAAEPLSGRLVDVADVLRERARADALAERVQLLQEANMALTVPRREAYHGPRMAAASD